MIVFTAMIVAGAMFLIYKAGKHASRQKRDIIDKIETIEVLEEHANSSERLISLLKSRSL